MNVSLRICSLIGAAFLLVNMAGCVTPPQKESSEDKTHHFAKYARECPQKVMSNGAPKEVADRVCKCMWSKVAKVLPDMPLENISSGQAQLIAGIVIYCVEIVSDEIVFDTPLT